MSGDRNTRQDNVTSPPAAQGPPSYPEKALQHAACIFALLSSSRAYNNLLDKKGGRIAAKLRRYSAAVTHTAQQLQFGVGSLEGGGIPPCDGSRGNGIRRPVHASECFDRDILLWGGRCVEESLYVEFKQKSTDKNRTQTNYDFRLSTLIHREAVLHVLH